MCLFLPWLPYLCCPPLFFLHFLPICAIFLGTSTTQASPPLTAIWKQPPAFVSRQPMPSHFSMKWARLLTQGSLPGCFPDVLGVSLTSISVIWLIAGWCNGDVTQVFAVIVLNFLLQCWFLGFSDHTKSTINPNYCTSNESENHTL